MTFSINSFNWIIIIIKKLKIVWGAKMVVKVVRGLKSLHFTFSFFWSFFFHFFSILFWFNAVWIPLRKKLVKTDGFFPHLFLTRLALYALLFVMNERNCPAADELGISWKPFLIGLINRWCFPQCFPFLLTVNRVPLWGSHYVFFRVWMAL